MDRRQFLKGVGWGAAALVAPGCTKSSQSLTSAKTKAKRPNILWIMTDQQPLSTLGRYGNPLGPTPAIDRLADNGVKFVNFGIAAFPCSPSRGCFFTGQHSHIHGVLHNDVLLEASIPTLGTICSAAGYDTAYFGKSHLGGLMCRNYKDEVPDDSCSYYGRVDSPDGFAFKLIKGGPGEDEPQMGFTEWAGGWKQYHEYLRSVGLEKFTVAPQIAGCHFVAQSGIEGTHMYSRLPEEHHMAAFFRTRAINFLNERKDKSRPFCMVVSFYAPHLPVAPPRPWDTKYSLNQVKLPSNHNDDLKSKPEKHLEVHQAWTASWTQQQYLDYVRRYYGYCAYIDAQVGKILAELDKTGQADDTIVVFTSDHGDMVAAHKLIYKLNFCGYDELLRVPFILRYPRLRKSGHTVNALVSSIDCLPSLLDLAGLAVPAGLPGRSFRRLLEGRDEKFRDFIVCNSSELNLTFYDTEWKYVSNWSKPELIDELYDRKTDPGELCNLACDPAYKKQLNVMRDRLAKWLKDSSHPYAEVIIKKMNLS